MQPTTTARGDWFRMIRRRDFLTLVGATGTMFLGRCWEASAAEDARLKSRPTRPTSSNTPGEHVLGFRGARDGLLYIPKSHDAGTAAPLAVMLHGAGNSARGMEFTFKLAETFGVIIVAPDSRQSTWDVVRGEWGPDVRFIDGALNQVFKRSAVD